MKKLDIMIKPIFVLILAIIYFFWKCEYDLIATLIAGIIIVAASFMTYFQYKKLKELEGAEVEEQQN